MQRKRAIRIWVAILAIACLAMPETASADPSPPGTPVVTASVDSSDPDVNVLDVSWTVPGEVEPTRFLVELEFATGTGFVQVADFDATDPAYVDGDGWSSSSELPREWGVDQTWGLRIIAVDDTTELQSAPSEPSEVFLPGREGDPPPVLEITVSGTPDPAVSLVAFDWTFSGDMEPNAFIGELKPTPESAWQEGSTIPVTGDGPWHMEFPMEANQEGDIDWRVRLAAVVLDGEEIVEQSPWSDEEIVFIPEYSRAWSTRFVQTGDPNGKTVLARPDREYADLSGFSDGALGFSPSANSENGMVNFHVSTESYAPEQTSGGGSYPTFSSTEGTRDTPIDLPTISVLPEEEFPAVEAFDGNVHEGGPVLYDPATGDRILFFHTEIFGEDGEMFETFGPGCDTENPFCPPTGHYNYVGAAYQEGGTDDWENLGYVLQTEQPFSAGYTNAEMGTGSFVVSGDDLFMYFTDSTTNSGMITSGQAVSVAKGSVEDMWDAARNGDTPAVYKWHNDAWDTIPASAGERPSTALTGGIFQSVIWNECRQEIWAAGSDYRPPAGGAEANGSLTTTWIRTSTDGIEWSDKEYLNERLGDRLYTSLAPRDVRDPMVIRGADFDLYSNVFHGTGWWDTADINRMSFRDMDVVEDGCVEGDPVSDDRPVLSIAPKAHAFERDGNPSTMTFQVQLEQPVDHDVDVAYWTEDRTLGERVMGNTAIAQVGTDPGDYEPQGSIEDPEIITIPEGEVQVEIPVTVYSDEAPEDPYKQFQVHIRTADPAVRLGHTLATGTIVDGDSLFLDSDAWVAIDESGSAFEGDPGSGDRKLVVTIAVSESLSRDVRVRLNSEDVTPDGYLNPAIGGTDYEALIDEIITIPAGTLGYRLEIPLTPDNDAIGDREFLVHMELLDDPPGVRNAGDEATLWIYDDDA